MPWRSRPSPRLLSTPKFGFWLVLASVLLAASSNLGRLTQIALALLEYLELCDENLAFAVDPVRLDRTAKERPLTTPEHTNNLLK